MKTPPDSALGDAQGIIADLRRQVAERTAERDEAVAQQTATAEVLSIINSSPGDLAPVFDAMLEKATSLCEAAFGFVDTYDGEFFHRIALRGATPEIAEFMTRTPHPVGPDNAHGRLLRGKSVVHIADITEDKAFRSGDPLRRALVELGGRTLLAVPLRKEGVFLGDFTEFGQLRREKPFQPPDPTQLVDLLGDLGLKSLLRAACVYLSPILRLAVWLAGNTLFMFRTLPRGIPKMKSCVG